MLMGCTLTQVDAHERLRQWRESVKAAQLDAYWNGTRLSVSFDSRLLATEETLQRLISAEADCCSFLDWSYKEQGTTTILYVAPKRAEDAPELRRLADLFQVRPAAIPWAECHEDSADLDPR